jgi:hypothetical protein
MFTYPCQFDSHTHTDLTVTLTLIEFGIQFLDNFSLFHPKMYLFTRIFIIYIDPHRVCKWYRWVWNGTKMEHVGLNIIHDYSPLVSTFYPCIRILPVIEINVIFQFLTFVSYVHGCIASNDSGDSALEQKQVSKHQWYLSRFIFLDAVSGLKLLGGGRLPGLDNQNWI